MRDHINKTDEELIEVVLSGNHSAFEEIFFRYHQKAYNLAMRISRNQDDAEEIIQEVFTSVFSKLNRFEGKSTFSSWLYRITVNTAFMKLRGRKKHDAMSLEDDVLPVQNCWAEKRSDASDVNFLSSRHELKQHISEAIDSLPSEYRAIFVMRDVDGLSNQEVAEVLNISIAAVKSRLHRTRLMLRKKLRTYHKDYTTGDFIALGPNATRAIPSLAA